MRKKIIGKVSLWLAIALAVCTGVSVQIGRMQLAQVTTAPVQKGKITHLLNCPARWDAGSGVVSWEVSAEDYPQYEELGKVTLLWWDGDEDMAEAKRIAKRRRLADGSWQLTLELTPKDAAYAYLAGREGISGSESEFVEEDKSGEGDMSGSAGETGDTGVIVSMEKSREYRRTVPVSALSATDSGYCVFGLRTSEGLFADEQRVYCAKVEVEDMDDVSAAVSGISYDDVVTSASRWLADDMRVVISQ